MTAPVDQARAYLAKIPGAVSGAGGHNQTFDAAMRLVQDFGLSIAEAKPLLLEYNARCAPPWTEHELDHKLADAYAKRDLSKVGCKVRKGVRWKHRSDDTARPVKATPSPTPPAQPGHYDVSDTAELPEPIPDGARAFLKTAFCEGENICLAQGRSNDEGREVPKDRGITLSREEWLKKLDAHAGDPNGFLKTANRNGIFVRVNPMKAGGSKADEVTAYRHVLLEFDEIPVAEQWGIIRASNVPCAAVISSGNRSLHAWVKVEAETLEEYKRRAELLYQHFAPYQPDNTKDPARLSRLPFCERGNSRQELLALNVGYRTFAEWLPAEPGTLPKIIDAAEFIARPFKEPDQLVRGILHRGSKLVLGGGSKSFKTWTLVDLALSVAHGKPWLGFETQPGKVLAVNFELPDWSFQSRLVAICKARGINLEAGRLFLENLRGYAANFEHLLPKLRAVAKQDFALIILDPIYKLYGNADENKAGDVARLMNAIEEELAVSTGAAVAFGAHFSKGNQAGKQSIDRISGSGVFARDPDSLMIFTRHETEDAFTVESTLRNFAPVDPFVVRWQFPTMQRDESLDPAKLKSKAGRPKSYTVETILEALGDQSLSTSEWQKLSENEFGISKSAFYDLLKPLRKSDQVLLSKVTRKWSKLNKHNSDKSENSDN